MHELCRLFVGARRLCAELRHVFHKRVFGFAEEKGGRADGLNHDSRLSETCPRQSALAGEETTRRISIFAALQLGRIEPHPVG